MKKLILFVFSAFFATTYLVAQNNKSVFVELGANGLGFSLNFDSRFKKVENGLGFRAGIGIIPAINQGELDILIPSTPSILTIPVGINHLLGKGPHYFESGFGVTYAYVNGNISSDFWGYDEKVTGGTFLFIPSVGYRHAKTGKAFQFRAVISPTISSAGAAFFAGISVGYKF